MSDVGTEFPDSRATFCVSGLSAPGVIMTYHRPGPGDSGMAGVRGLGHFEVSRICHPPIMTAAVDRYALRGRMRDASLAVLEACRTGQS